MCLIGVIGKFVGSPSVSSFETHKLNWLISTPIVTFHFLLELDGLVVVGYIEMLLIYAYV
jgi:hypothetical protein